MTAPVDDVRIVPCDPSLRERLHAFWAEILGRHWNETARRRGEWLDSRRTHYLALDGERVVGNATLLRQPFLSPSREPFDLGWITDFYVLPRMKGRGLGKLLTRRLVEEAGTLASFGQSAAARGCFASLGWTGPAWIPLAGVVLPQLGARPARGFRFEEIAPEDARIDVVWQARRRGSALGRRDAAALSARCSGRPDGRYRLFLATGDAGPAGWVVTRLIREARNRRFGPVPAGLIVDLLAVEDRLDVARALAAHAVHTLARAGALLLLAVATPGVTATALHEAGFREDLRVAGVPLRRLPAKGYMAAPGVGPLLGGGPALSFFDCDAELTF